MDQVTAQTIANNALAAYQAAGGVVNVGSTVILVVDSSGNTVEDITTAHTDAPAPAEVTGTLQTILVDRNGIPLDALSVNVLSAPPSTVNLPNPLPVHETGTPSINITSSIPLSVTEANLESAVGTTGDSGVYADSPGSQVALLRGSVSLLRSILDAILAQTCPAGPAGPTDVNARLVDRNGIPLDSLPVGIPTPLPVSFPTPLAVSDSGFLALGNQTDPGVYYDSQGSHFALLRAVVELQRSCWNSIEGLRQLVSTEICILNGIALQLGAPQTQV